ncbi:tyrosine-type recombinase/integrase [Tuberibacillus sp. Marseille-P3662]|uniref:tyrosine-type recombinase/integrase n=1 Tax=Tuberibacillus sp. Marseille-P3662 TaxID=1965358 RepID=UPI000A1CBEF8|nr:site-specific integrase [Tuberibacillus sp. Marseille-P3662]
MYIEGVIKQFLRNRRASGLADKTIELSEYVMRDFSRYCINTGIIMVNELDEAFIEEYFVYLKYEKTNQKHGGRLSDNTLANYFKVISVFAKFIQRRSFLSFDITQGISAPSLSNGIKQTFSMEQLRYIINNSREDYRTLFRLMLNLGLRISEGISLKRSDIHLDECMIEVYRKKVRKYDLLPFSQELRDDLACYLDKQEQENLFTFKADTVRRYLRRLCEGAEDKLGFASLSIKPHLFRHTFAKHWIMSEGDAFSLQRMLGHSSPHMTSHYVNLFSTDLAKKHKKHAIII